MATKYFSLSPYNSMGNNPVYYNDPNGDEIGPIGHMAIGAGIGGLVGYGAAKLAGKDGKTAGYWAAAGFAIGAGIGAGINAWKPDGIEYADMLKIDRKALKHHIRSLSRGSETFNQIWKDLKKSDYTHTIHSTTPDDMHVEAKGGDYLAEGNSTDIYLNPYSNPIGIPQEVAIAHEVGHSWRIDQGLEPEYSGIKDGESPTPEGFVYALKHKQYREFEATHIENIVRSEMKYSLREVYGTLNDNHTGNTNTIFGEKFLDLSKNRPIIIGRDKSYNYSSPYHYQNLKARTRSKSSFNTKKYTDAASYN